MVLVYQQEIKMNDWELNGRIKDAVEKNILFYDEHGKGNITKRLVYLMYGHSDDLLERVLIPTDVYPEFDFSEPLYGVSFVRDKRLNYEGSKKIIEEHEMCLLNHKDQLVLGIWGDESILGAV
jgi:hypothetical protein